MTRIQRLLFIFFIGQFRGSSSLAAPKVSLYEDESSPVIHTSVGDIRGLRATDGDYSMYLGIPYAQVNEHNPFGASEPYKFFEETFDAIDDSAICPQIEQFNHSLVGDLDCLHLNIYVPNIASADNPLPVMVVIYGGMWAIGFASRFVFGPNFLIRHDVILVTFNYRVGPYGFMCLDIPEVPGNQGLKDQLIALRWIKENIAAFGGDNTRITLLGNSAGGISTDLHVYFGQNDLFHRIILQSGVALYNAVKDSDPTTALELAKYFNYTPSDLNDALSFLATKDALEIIAVSNKIGLAYTPCVEKSFDNVEKFITEHPVNMDPKRVKEIDVLIGYNNDESYCDYALISDELLPNEDIIGDVVDEFFVFGDKKEPLQEMKKVVTNFYFGDNDITGEMRQSMADVASDFKYNHPILRTLKKYLDNDVENLYLYLFSYCGGRDYTKKKKNVTGSREACHADELGYLYDISYMEKPLDPVDELIVDRMTELWTNFVKYGDPTPTVTELVPLRWPQVTRDKWHYLEIDTDLRISTRPMHDRMAFLDLLYKANEEYQRGFERAPSAGRSIVLDISLSLLFAVRYFL